MSEIDDDRGQFTTPPAFIVTMMVLLIGIIVTAEVFEAQLGAVEQGEVTNIGGPIAVEPWAVGALVALGAVVLLAHHRLEKPEQDDGDRS